MSCTYIISQGLNKLFVVVVCCYCVVGCLLLLFVVVCCYLLFVVICCYCCLLLLFVAVVCCCCFTQQIIHLPGDSEPIKLLEIPVSGTVFIYASLIYSWLVSGMNAVYI